MDGWVNYQEWEQTVPQSIKDDALWRMKVYRLVLFAGRIGWEDVTKLANDHRTKPMAGQLYPALGSIGANLAEGYSRSSGKDRARLYEYALGSARECREWYYRAEPVLSSEVIEHRLRLLSEAIRLMLAMLPDQRTQEIREDEAAYETSQDHPDV